MTYELDFTETALQDLAWLKRHEPSAYKKALRLIEELKTHPTTGTGRPEQLRSNLSGQWSRRINAKHRLIYSINGGVLTVLILAAVGHYSDN